MSREAVDRMTARIKTANPRISASKAREAAVKAVVKAERGKKK